MVSEESFMENLKPALSKLKLKATYGLTGNDQIGATSDRFFYMSRVTIGDGNKASQFGTSLGYKLNGTSIIRYADPNITWEVSRKFNLGLELGLLNDFELQADYFRERRSNILQYRADIPVTMGLQQTPSSNIGEAKSHGMEFSLDYNRFFNKDFWVTVRGTFTYASSEYSIYEEPDYTAAGVPWLSRTGYSLSQPYGYIAERLFIDEEDVRNSPFQSFSEYGPGDIKYKDINLDGQITSLDQVPIGLPTTPEIIYGFGFSTGYRSFDLSCFFQGSGNSSFFINPTSTSPFSGGTRAILKAYADDHWTEANQNPYALWPRLSPTIITNNTQQSTWWLRSGQFLRLKSAELGYALPQNLVKKASLAGARIYLSGTNLLLFSEFKMWDIEMAGNGLGYPLQRVLNIGLKVDF
jgi:TonB-linked SusC/RagA family outer membrane protein